MAEDSKEKQQQKQKKAASSKTIDSWKKKKWYMLLAPEAFNHFELGETPANMPDEVEGRTVISNLMVLTGNSKRQNTNVIFRVTKVQGDKAYTEFINYQMAPASIKPYVIVKSSSPSVKQFLLLLATADGAVDPGGEIAIP